LYSSKSHHIKCCFAVLTVWIEEKDMRHMRRI